MKKKTIKKLIGISAVAITAKVAYDKVKQTKQGYAEEEAGSVNDEVKKYNAFFDKKSVVVEDEEFTGCDLKSVCSDVVIDLGLAVFAQDSYINIASKASNVMIVLPDDVNVSVDVKNKASNLENHMDCEDGKVTVYLVGEIAASNVSVVPVDFSID